MKTKAIKWLSLVLAGLLLFSTLVACGKPEEDVEETSDTTGAAETETVDEAQAALDALGEIDWGGREFAILYASRFKNEVSGVKGTVDEEGGSSQVINDAVYERNSLFEDRCNLTLAVIEKDDAGVLTSVQNEASAPTGDFQFIDNRLRETASLATSGYLYDFLELGVDIDAEWWDTGTADFVLEGGVYFMNGSINISDDGVTYVLIFNKEMQKTYSNTVPNPYETVMNWEWTLDYFNTVIQGVSADNGDGAWDEKDTYGFITTWEYGNTFFIGSDLRYVLNDADSVSPSLYLSESGRLEKALSVLSTSRAIYHNNNATYMSPAGQEGLGATAFKENRGLFYGEVANYLPTLNASMDGEYGVVPVPKYDKAQEYYRTWTHDSGSTFSITSAISADDAETVGAIMNAYAILSHQYLKPAYYDTMLTTRNVHDAESSDMLDIIFQNRVYDMAFYFDLGFYDLFKTNVNKTTDDNFSSSYASASKSFTKRMNNILKKLQKD